MESDTELGTEFDTEHVAGLGTEHEGLDTEFAAESGMELDTELAAELKSRLCIEDSAPEIEYICNEEGSTAYIVREWMSEEESKRVGELIQVLPWEKQRLVIRGINVLEPRRTVALSSDGKIVHRYSGIARKMRDWDLPEYSVVRDICARLNAETELQLNSCLINEYATGADYIGWHSDKETKPPMHVVATVSYGGPRDFYTRNKVTKKVLHHSLGHGDLFVMSGRFNTEHHHSIPKRAKADYRVSLTYREMS